VALAPEPPPVAPVAAPVAPTPLDRVAFCESGNRQFGPDGQPLRGAVNPDDVGKYQINEDYHLEAAVRLGLDLNTLEGNEAYARHLYASQGLSPWLWSRPCWGDETRVWVYRDGAWWS